MHSILEAACLLQLLAGMQCKSTAAASQLSLGKPRAAAALLGPLPSLLPPLFHLSEFQSRSQSHCTSSVWWGRQKLRQGGSTGFCFLFCKASLLPPANPTCMCTLEGLEAVGASHFEEPWWGIAASPSTPIPQAAVLHLSCTGISYR